MANTVAPVIRQGWVRALLLLVIYVGLSVTAGFFTPNFETWITVSFLIAVVCVYLFRRFVDKKSFEGIGLRYHDMLPHAITGTLLAIFIVCGGALFIYFLNGIEWLDILPVTDELFVNAILLLMVAIGEELVFRGYVLRNLIKSMNRWLALALSALLFTIVHASDFQVPVTGLANIFLGGALLGITFMHTRSLWMPVLFHFMWNFIQGPLLGFPVSGIEFSSILIMDPGSSTLLSGGDYGFEGSLVCTGLLILASAIWLWKEKSHTRKQVA